jgi:DNA-binding MarR family transcriptional regulator
MKQEVNIEHFADRIKQTLTATAVPTYDWMYKLGLNSTQLGVYAYIFNVCKTEPMKEHVISTRTIAELFNMGTSNASIVTLQLSKLGLINKRVEGKAKAQCFYSIYQPN